MKATIKTILATVAVLVTACAAPVLAQTPDASTNTWQSSVNIGGTLSRGNSENTLFSAGIGTEKKWIQDSLAFGADALYGTSKSGGQPKSTETAEALHGFGQYNHDFTSSFFGYGRMDGLHDGIADLQYRLTLAPGLGYYFIKKPVFDLSLEGGPAFIDEELGHHYQDYAALRVAQKLHWAISARSKFWETIECLPQVDKFNNYIVNFELGVEAGLNKNNNLSLRTVLQDTYNNVPARGLLKNDLKLIVGIGYKF